MLPVAVPESIPVPVNVEVTSPVTVPDIFVAVVASVTSVVPVELSFPHVVKVATVPDVGILTLAVTEPFDKAEDTVPVGVPATVKFTPVTEPVAALTVAATPVFVA